MTDIENKYYQAALDDVESQPVTGGLGFKLKVGVGLFAGSCLMLFSFVASISTLSSTSATESTNLIGMSPALRMSPGAAMVPRGMSPQDLSAYGTGLGGLKKYAIHQIADNLRSHQVRDISMKAEKTENQMIKETLAEAKEQAEQMEKEVKLKAEDMAGVTAPMGLFDPLGFSTDVSTGKLLFFREVELKHGRVGMLAALGFLVGENFHPLFGGDIDVPAYVAFQQTPLQKFWPAVLLAISIPEVFSVFSFNSPFGMNIVDQMWTIKSDRVPGDLGFDPLGIKPTDPKKFKDMQTKELNNGRLAMLAAAGMLAQELATGKKLF